MKKFEEAELEVTMIENCVIATSGCTGENAGGCTTYFSDTDTDTE